MTTGRFLTVALYQFAPLADPAALRQPLQALCEAEGVKGTLLLAPEGINGTIAALDNGPKSGVRAVLAHLRGLPGFAKLEHKESWANTAPFLRMKVRIKKEIVTLGVPGVDPSRQAGTYVKPQDWNALIQDPDVLLIDTRNDYEVDIGSFAGAVDPRVKTFADLPAWVEAQEQGGALDGVKAHAAGRKKKVAMFCTGGIRCEKSTAYLKMRGYDEVFHLQGGILKYLEEVPADQSLWQGECFVFDERVSVGHGLQPGPYELCRSCRHPVGDAERASPQFVRGISCPHCWSASDADRRQRLAERQRQVELAQSAGVQHLAAPPPATGDAPALAAVLPLLADPVGRLLHWAGQVDQGRHGPGAPILLALVGMPGSGKSTLASAWAAEANRRLNCTEEAPAIVALGMDGFHIPKAQLRQMPQGEHALLRRGAPWTFDAHALRANVLRLAQQSAPDSIAARGHPVGSKGQISSQSPDPVTWPGFEHGVGDPVPGAIRVPPSARVILIEGLYLLHHGDGWHCRDLFDEAWALDVPTALARARTIARHMAANGNTAQQAQARWHGNDRLNAAVVRKSARHAQFRVDNPDRNASTEPHHEH